MQRTSTQDSLGKKKKEHKEEVKNFSNIHQDLLQVLTMRGEGNGKPLQYSCLENPVDSGGLMYIGSHRVRHDWGDLACMNALEKEMATHSSILAWRIPGTEESGGLPSMGSRRVGHDWSDLAAAAAVSLDREGNGTPLQYSCLENPMDGGAWWTAAHGIPKSRTQLSNFTFTFTLWRRKWQPTPVFLPGESQGWGSLVGCRLQAHTESDTTEAT